MYRIGPAVAGGLDDFGDTQVCLVSGVARQGHGLLRRGHVGSACVRVGIDCYGGNSNGAESLVNSDRDFASIGYQDFGDHPSTRSVANIRRGAVWLRRPSFSSL